MHQFASFQASSGSFRARAPSGYAYATNETACAPRSRFEMLGHALFFAAADVLRCYEDLEFLNLCRRSAARARCRPAGATPGFPAGTAGSLAAGIGQMQAIVADNACALDAEAVIDRGRLGKADRRVPIQAHEPLTLAPPDQYLVALDRHEQFQSLYPFDRNAQGVVMTKI